MLAVAECSLLIHAVRGRNERFDGWCDIREHNANNLYTLEITNNSNKYYFVCLFIYFFMLVIAFHRSFVIYIFSCEFFIAFEYLIQRSM